MTILFSAYIFSMEFPSQAYQGAYCLIPFILKYLPAFIIIRMDRKLQSDAVDVNADDESSSIEDNARNQPAPDDGRDSANDTKKRSNEKESEVRRIFINNRSKDKKLQNDSTYEGIYLYKPGVQLPSLYQFANQTVKIIIASEYIKRHNPELLKRNIYGADPYTSNSDAVCMLVHSGSININTFPTKRFEGIELSCKVIKPKKNYTGSFKNGIMSRNLKGYNGNALKPESVRNLTSLGPMELLERYAANMHIPIGKNRIKPKPRNISNIVPIPETHIVFNMNNEPAYKYSIFNIADKGFEKNEFITKKLDNYVLYLETNTQQKYEIVKNSSDVVETYRVSRVKNPEKTDNEFFEGNKCPLDDDLIENLYSGLEWEDIQWGNISICLKSQRKIEGIRSFKYYKKDSK